MILFENPFRKLIHYPEFSGGGGAPKPPPPPPVEKPVETRRIVEQAGVEREAERKRVPPGRKATMFAGIEKMLKDRLGK